MVEYLGTPQTNKHQTRKRKPERSIEASAEKSPKCARLTKENLKALEKMAGSGKGSGKVQKSKSLRSRKSSYSTKTKSSATTESSRKTVSTTCSNFLSLTYANGILQEPNAKPPQNLNVLEGQWNRRRDTASPTESEFKVAVHKLLVAENEGTIAEETSKLLKDHGVTEYRRATNLPFKDFPRNVGLNNGLSAAQPDMMEGFERPEFEPFPVSQELGAAAIPYLSANAITLPHFAGEWKGLGKDMILARGQAAYDGASMVYARKIARSYLESPDPVGHAFVASFTSDGTSVRTFANYFLESEGKITYHQWPMSSTFITTFDGFKTGRRQLRNAQDYAKQTSEKLRDELNENWLANHCSSVAPSVAAETAEPVDDNDSNHEDKEGPK